MKLKGNPFPGYENHYMSYMTGEEDELKAAKEAQAKDLFGYTLPEGAAHPNLYPCKHHEAGSDDAGDSWWRLDRRKYRY